MAYSPVLAEDIVRWYTDLNNARVRTGLSAISIPSVTNYRRQAAKESDVRGYITQQNAMKADKYFGLITYYDLNPHSKGTRIRKAMKDNADNMRNQFNRVVCRNDATNNFGLLNNTCTQGTRDVSCTNGKNTKASVKDTNGKNSVGGGCTNGKNRNGTAGNGGKSITYGNGTCSNAGQQISTVTGSKTSDSKTIGPAHSYSSNSQWQHSVQCGNHSPGLSAGHSQGDLSNGGDNNSSCSNGDKSNNCLNGPNTQSCMYEVCPHTTVIDAGNNNSVRTNSCGVQPAL